MRNNLSQFEDIAAVMGTLGVKRCITSFMDDYRKIQKRVQRLPGFSFVYPSTAEQVATLVELGRTSSALGIELLTCCESEILALLPAGTPIRASSCIPNELLQSLFGGNISLRYDYGQRTRKGCGCRVSRDVGSYREQPCHHNCLYCYANPTVEPIGT